MRERMARHPYYLDKKWEHAQWFQLIQINLRRAFNCGSRTALSELMLMSVHSVVRVARFAHSLNLTEVKLSNPKSRRILAKPKMQFAKQSRERRPLGAIVREGDYVLLTLTPETDPDTKTN